MSRETDQDAISACDLNTELIETPKGTITIYPRCASGFFSSLKLDAGLGNFSHYSSIIQKLEVFEKVSSSKDGKVGLALREDNIVVGYLACWYPDQAERWSKLGELMYEMGAVEVSRNFRHLQIAQKMISLILVDDFFEDKIAYMNGFSWHWDLDGSGLTMAEYRKMMMHLLKGHGFQEFYTNEPNIALREENIFMARIGSRVPAEQQQMFRNLRFGIVDRN
ncbi:MAG: N-acetyltransferase [Desulfomonilaceae bacterium]